MQIKDQVVFITGAGSGIGRALANAVFEHGAGAVVCADLNEEAARETAEPLGDTGLALGLDVTDAAAVKTAVATTEQRFGPIGLYVSNAGIALGDGPDWTVISQSDEQYEKVWRVNVHAHVLAARAVLPGMIERGSGGFLITASAAGLLTAVGDTSYSVTKHAAVGFAESLAITHGDDGIYVGCLCPQGVESAMTAGLRGSIIHQMGIMPAGEMAAKTLQAIEEGRFMIRPHAEVVEYFQHKAADYDRWIGGMRKLRRNQMKITGKGF